MYGRYDAVSAYPTTVRKPNMLNRIVLMATSASASVVSCLIAFNVVSPDKGAAIGGVVSALAVGWHAGQMRGTSGN